MIIWHNPSSLPEFSVVGEDTVAAWRAKPVTEKNWKDTARLSWDISPALAVYLPMRLKKSESIVREVSRQVRLNPILVSHIPEALKYLLTTETILNDAHEVSFNVLTLS